MTHEATKTKFRRASGSPWRSRLLSDMGSDQFYLNESNDINDIDDRFEPGTPYTIEDIYDRV